jgi:outer membrane receptor protein involved in Fe transport
VSNQIPYVAETSGTVGVELGHEPWGLSVSADAQYQGPMLIQTFESAGIDDELGFRETSSFWITNLRVTQRLGAGVALFAGVDNIGDEVQEDLRDPSTDYTWGPLRGRYYYGGLSYTLGE